MTFRFDPHHLHSETYRVPGSATENGLPADSWTVLAELESHEAPAVLDALFDAKVGGYTVAARGRDTKSGRQQLYVDAAQYNRAEEVLMDYLRGKTVLPVGASARNSASPPKRRHPVVAAAKRTAAIPALRWSFRIIGGAVAVAGFLLLVYLYGAERFPAVQKHHPTGSPSAPVMNPPTTGLP